MKNYGNYALLVVVFIVLLVVIVVITMTMKRKKYVYLVQQLEKGEFQAFDKEVSKVFTKLLFPPFTLDYLKLNGYILQNDQKKTSAAFDSFTKKRLGVKQKEMIYMMAFNYYINLEKYDDAKRYLDLINKLDNVQMKKEANRMYDIYALKGYRYLDEMLEEVESMQDTYKGVHEFLISLMYENKNDHVKSEMYRKQSEKHMKLLDRKISKKR